MFSWLQSRRVGSAKLHEPVLHPEAGEDWFLALPHDHRARMNREWREELDHRGRLLSYAHMFWLVPAGSACAYLGIEREE